MIAKSYKTQILALLALTILIVSSSMGQELLTNGDFETAGGAGWTQLIIGNAPTIDLEYTGGAPTGGSGNVLRINSTGDQHGGVYQSVSLTAGTKYIFSGVASCTGWNQGWLEMYIGQTVPQDGVDYGDGLIVKYNWWGCGSVTSFDSEFSSACDTAATEFVPSATGTYYVVMRGGSIAGGAGDYLIDNVSLFEDVPVPPQVLPLIADFNTDLNNNLLGTTGPDYCGDKPTLEAAMLLSADGEGASGLAGDKCLDIDVDLPKCTADQWMGIRHHEYFSSIDITGSIISFDVKLGSPTAAADWFVRLEDNINIQQYNNVGVNFTATTEWQTIELPIELFQPGDGSQELDPSAFGNMVIDIQDVAGLPSDPVEIDIQFDNLSIVLPPPPTAADSNSWSLYE